MNKKVLWITETAVLLALLVVLQWVTKPLGQIVTGSCVNAVLAVSALLVGLSSGLTVALISPVCAYLLGVAPNLVAVPAIMAGNAVFVLALSLLCGKALWRQALAWLVAAAGCRGCQVRGALHPCGGSHLRPSVRLSSGSRPYEKAHDRGDDRLLQLASAGDGADRRRFGTVSAAGAEKGT